MPQNIRFVKNAAAGVSKKQCQNSASAQNQAGLEVPVRREPARYRKEKIKKRKDSTLKIAITATGPTLDDHVETRFGRGAYFLVVDPDTLDFEAIKNPNITAGGGAGIQSAQLMADKNVEVILTGNCGPNAFQVFGASGINVIVGVSGPIRDAITNYKQGAFSSTTAPNVVSHFGMGAASEIQGVNTMSGGRGMGGGGGMGGGRGGGMGGGRGMQSGGGIGAGAAPVAAPGELESLKAQAQAIETQLGTVTSRIGGQQPGVALSALVAVVDADKCIGCGICVQSCPVEAIDMEEIAEIDREKCNGCGRCVIDCPQEAISLQKR